MHLISNEGERNKCYVKVCILESFSNFYKTISESISCNVPDFFHLKSTQRETGHSKGTQALSHLKHLGMWALKHLKGTQALKAVYLADSQHYNRHFFFAFEVFLTKPAKIRLWMQRLLWIMDCPFGKKHNIKNIKTCISENRNNHQVYRISVLERILLLLPMSAVAQILSPYFFISKSSWKKYQESLTKIRNLGNSGLWREDEAG